MENQFAVFPRESCSGCGDGNFLFCLEFMWFWRSHKHAVVKNISPGYNFSSPSCLLDTWHFFFLWNSHPTSFFLFFFKREKPFSSFFLWENWFQFPDHHSTANRQWLSYSFRTDQVGVFVGGTIHTSESGSLAPESQRGGVGLGNRKWRQRLFQVTQKKSWSDNIFFSSPARAAEKPPTANPDPSPAHPPSHIHLHTHLHTCIWIEKVCVRAKKKKK